ncbi:SDR family oxidoreductase [Telluria mixta]|uniref:SDR family oxidoreductase n=1 Tax=Telluria mixta TaxID=34071 RepID=A0ABT2BSU1_9BURK|nr:SDR family oxidoreductase [Telluria mixta]MCS0628116.1 SDR family oxidoreductase [Telluria mixta]WEM93768.1 SDR family oxidoreductase [Telluria mixta]
MQPRDFQVLELSSRQECWRPGRAPREIAEAAVWLSSTGSSYVHGQLLVIDGGMTIGGFEL